MVIFVEKTAAQLRIFRRLLRISKIFCKFAPNKNEIGRRGCMICSSLAVAIQ